MTRARLRLSLLGTFRLEHEGERVRLPTRKIESLLAYLALHPEPHAREKLAALFWGDFSDKAARASLRHALALLRKPLGSELFLTDHATVQIDPTVFLWVDAREFEQTAREVPESAIRLYQADLLSDFYDDWLAQLREHYRTLYLDTLLLLIRELRARSEYPRAIQLAERVLVNDPANEIAHQHLMFCHLANGNRALALNQYDACKRALLAELATEPSRETIELYEWIKQSPLETRTAAARLTNLPIPVSSFIGRKRESAIVKAMFEQARLLTLLGAGGSGKTRLAIQVARDLLDTFQDGVWWIELASLTDETLVPQAVAKALGVRESPLQSVSETLMQYLRPRQLLLVLDNCEHVLIACARLCETLLNASPQLQILTTSREALGIIGERIFHVPPLALPDLQRPAPTERLIQSESIQLFVERANELDASFALTDQNAMIVARICQQLDGLPLAIELAAASTRMFSVDQIDLRLNDRFELLTLGSRTALPRQQTLRATMDWSYDLLESNEQTLLRRLAVFVGGCTLEAVEQICVDRNDANSMLARDDLYASQVLSLLTRLVDKSIVSVDTLGETARYYMLETILQYAYEKLAASEAIVQLKNLHLKFFLAFAEAENKLHYVENASVSFDRLELEHPNLRAALSWALATDSGEAGLRLASTLWWFWSVRGYLREGSHWLHQVLGAPSSQSVTDEARAQALLAAAGLAWRQGDVERATMIAGQSLVLCEKLGNKGGMAFSLGTLGAVAWYQGDYSIAEQRHREALALRKEIGQLSEAAYSMGHLALVAWAEGNLEEAVAWGEEALTLQRQVGNKWHLADALTKRGTVARAAGEIERADSLFRECLTLQQDLGDRSNSASTLEGLACLAAIQSQPIRAAILWGSGEALRESSNALLPPAYQSDYEPLITQARALLDADLFTATWAQGRAMAFDQALAYGLQHE